MRYLLIVFLLFLGCGEDNPNAPQINSGVCAGVSQIFSSTMFSCFTSFTQIDCDEYEADESSQDSFGSIDGYSYIWYLDINCDEWCEQVLENNDSCYICSDNDNDCISQ